MSQSNKTVVVLTKTLHLRKQKKKTKKPQYPFIHSVFRGVCMLCLRQCVKIPS